MDSERHGMSDGDVIFVAIVALILAVFGGACAKAVIDRIDRMETAIMQKENTDGT